MNKENLKVTIIISTLVFTTYFSAYMHYQSQKKLEAVLEASQQSTHIITFTMDKSCYDQINNSTDGILRIKFNKQ